MHAGEPISGLDIVRRDCFLKVKQKAENSFILPI